MPKRFIKKSCVLVLILALLLPGVEGVSPAQEEGAAAASAEPTILATEGLKETEKAALERTYQYQYRHKDLILEPAISTPFAEEPTISPIDIDELNEQEKLYRYFGIASVLYESGNLEEAVEILKYILSKKPDDEYVRRYLGDIQREMKHEGAKWRITARKDAALLKKTRIKRLMREGVAYYKQKHFDMALSRFADILTLDPDNAAAKRYVNKLEKHYLKEVRVEGIVEEWEAKIAETRGEEPGFAEGSKEEGIIPQVAQVMGELLDEAELREKGVSPKMSQAAIKLLDKAEREKERFTPREERVAKRLLDKEEMARTIRSARASSLIDQAELNLRVEEIIAQRRKEERKTRSYTLGPGDKIKISVQDHPELSGNATVGPEGEIVLPLVNEPLIAEGLTAGELSKETREILTRYVKEPVVYVGITAYKSKIFYVIDETGSTPYTITRANFTLRDALFMSDWGSNRALGRVLVIKPHKLHPFVRKVDAFDLVYRGNLSRNVRIENGDVIYVPLTAAKKISTTIADTLSPIKAVRDVRTEWLDWRWDLQDGWYNLPRIPRSEAVKEDSFSEP